MMKVEFDKHRVQERVVPALEEQGYRLKPWNDERLYEWRESGMQVPYQNPYTGVQFLLEGKPDELLIDASNMIVVADFKSTGSTQPVNIYDPEKPYFAHYRRQIAIYQWQIAKLLQGNVHPTALFLFSRFPTEDYPQNCGAFSVSATPYTPPEWSQGAHWMDVLLNQIHELLSRPRAPDPNPHCKLCTTVLDRLRYYKDDMQRILSVKRTHINWKDIEGEES